METNNTSKKFWFKRKKYGWGWAPATWQGWLSLAGYTFFLSCYPVFFADEKSFSMGVFLIIAILLTVGLVIVCFQKGEKPTWSWGDDKTKKYRT